MAEFNNTALKQKVIIDGRSNPTGETLANIYKETGVCIITNLLSADDIKKAKQGTCWAFDYLPQERYKFIRQRSYEWFETHPIFVSLIKHPLILDFSSQIFGSDYHLVAAQCSRNTQEEPYIPNAMRIHRDRELLPKPGYIRADKKLHEYGVTAMWYVQDTPLDMGPTEFIPGTHKLEIEFENDNLDPTYLFNEYIPAGTLILFSHRTWHRGRFNKTNQPRDLISNVYALEELDKYMLKLHGEGGKLLYDNPEDYYVPCQKLIAQGDKNIEMLLKPRRA